MKSLGKTLALMILPIQVLSTSNGTAIETNVSTTGNSDIQVETQVESSSNSTTTVRTTNESSVTVKDGDTSVYKKMEIEVNGKKKTLETTEQGTHVLQYKDGEFDVSTTSAQAADESTSSASKKATEGFEGETLSLRQYIVEQVQTFLKRLFGGFLKN